MCTTVCCVTLKVIRATCAGLLGSFNGGETRRRVFPTLLVCGILRWFIERTAAYNLLPGNASIRWYAHACVRVCLFRLFR